MLVGLAALAVSICAVAVSIYEASLERTHARASVWPHLEITIGISNEGARLAVLNSGVGPASLDEVAIFVDGRRVAGWADVFARVLDRQPDAYSVTSVSGRVLRSGDELTMLQLPASALPADIMNRLPHVGIEICYRSVFDERWRLRIEKLVGASRWESVKSCGSGAESSAGF